MSRIELVNPAASTEAAPLLEQIPGAFGVPNMFCAVANFPTALRSMWGAFGALGGGTLGARLGEQIAVAVAARNDCAYCLAAHAVLGQKAGASAQEMAAAQSGESDDPRTQAAYRGLSVQLPNCRITKQAGRGPSYPDGTQEFTNRLFCRNNKARWGPMAGEIIRKGDPTNHGGVVLEGSLTDICMGQPIAYVGHKVQCPKCKGVFPIAEGVLTTTFYGKGVAAAGMKTACGAVLIATQFTDTVEWSSGGAGSGFAKAASATQAQGTAATAAAAGSAMANYPADSPDEQDGSSITRRASQFPRWPTISRPRMARSTRATRTTMGYVSGWRHTSPKSCPSGSAKTPKRKRRRPDGPPGQDPIHPT